MIAAPAHRPASSFSTAKAQRWILATAIVVALTYTLRKIVEPTLAAGPGLDTKTAARLAGLTGPPPSLAHWAIAYGTGFTLLALIALPAPELAASLSMLVLVGTVLSNGKGLSADLNHLEGRDPTPSVKADEAYAQRVGNHLLTAPASPFNWQNYLSHLPPIPPATAPKTP